MINNFKTKKIDLLNLGEQLKKTRKDKKISLEQVSKATQIQKRYLEYLENGQYEKLPGDVYIKFFLKTYALFLKMDLKKVIALYEKEKRIREKLKGSFFKKKKKLRNGNKNLHFIITPKVIVLVLSALIILAILIYFFYQISFLTKPPELIVTMPTEDLIVKEEKILIRGKTQINAELSINDENVWLDHEGGFSQELFLQEGINIIKITAVNKFGKKNEIIRKIIYEP